MNGYELVRKQATQDQEIDARLPLAGGTMTGSILVGNATTDIGDNANRFRNGYFGKLYTNVNAGIDVGNWNWSGANNYFQVTDTTNWDVKLQLGPNYAQFYNEVRPNIKETIDLGLHGLSWRHVWHNGLRSPSPGFLLSANDDPANTANRGGLWINSSGIRPLRGDNSNEYCGQNGFRWSAVWCVNANNLTSDRELKTNIKRLDNSKTRNIDDKKFYNFVKDDLNFYSWDWKSEELNKDIPTNIGVMAQELEQSEVGRMIVIPPKEEEVEKEVIDEDGNRTLEKEIITTHYAINDRNMYMSLGIALKQSINEIETLKQENQELKDRLKLIEERLAI